MDDERAPVFIEQRVEPLRQSHPARDRIQLSDSCGLLDSPTAEHAAPLIESRAQRYPHTGTWPATSRAPIHIIYL